MISLEYDELKKDLRAFLAAHACVHNRVRESKDETRTMQLVNWSGTSAVMGSLDLTIHAMERTLEEVSALLKKIDAGVIPNLDEEEHV